jgi:hypothetical protein
MCNQPRPPRVSERPNTAKRQAQKLGWLCPRSSTDLALAALVVALTAVTREGTVVAVIDYQ